MIRHDCSLFLGLAVGFLSGCVGGLQRNAVELPREGDGQAAAGPASVRQPASPEPGRLASAAQSPYRTQPLEEPGRHEAPPLPDQVHVPALAPELPPEPPAASPASQAGTELRRSPLVSPLFEVKTENKISAWVEPEKATFQPVDPPLVAALRCLLDKRGDEAVGHLLGYDKFTQQMLLYLLPVVATAGSGSLESAPPNELGNLMDQLVRAEDVLRPRAPLVIDRMCYCRDISGWGVCEELREDHPFRPGELVEVYAELRNCLAERKDDSWEVRLAGTVEIRDPAGKSQPWVVYPERVTIDRTRTPRRDHFRSYRFWIPDNLRPGHYTLQLQVSDLATKPPRIARRTLHLWITTRPGK